MVFDSDNYNVTDFVVAHNLNKNNKKIADKFARMRADMDELLTRKLRFEAATEAALGVLREYVEKGVLSRDEVNRNYKQRLDEEKAKRGVD